MPSHFEHYRQANFPPLGMPQDPRMQWYGGGRQSTPFQNHMWGRRMVNTVNSGLGLRRTNNYFGREMFGRMQQVTNYMHGMQNPMMQSLQGARFPGQTNQELQRIISTLSQRGPQQYGGARNRMARYLLQSGRGANSSWVRRGNPMTVRYTIDTRRLGNDIRYIRGLRSIASSRQQQQFLQGLERSMVQYGDRIDPVSMAGYRYNQLRSNSPMSRATGKIGRLALLLGAGSIAAINGIAGIRTGTLSLAPFLYGGVAWWAADPTVLHGRGRRAVAQAQRTVIPLQQGGLGMRHGIQGPMWAQFAQRIMSQPMSSQTRNLLRRAGRNQLNPQQHAQLVQELSRGSPAVSTALNQMIQSGYLRTFVSNLRSIRNPDTRQLVGEYIRAGAWRYAPSMPRSPAAQSFNRFL